MASWVTLGFTLGLQSIEAAYRSASEAFEREISSHNAAYDKLRDARQAEDEEFDVHGYSEHLADLACESEMGLRLIREAFALTLYHFWEKQAISLLSMKGGPEHKEIVKKIKATGRLSLDEPGMERLRQIANVVKHSNGAGLYAQNASLFAPEAAELDPDPKQRAGWHLFLRLEDKDVQSAIRAVRASGPAPNYDALRAVEDGGDEPT